MTKNLLFLATAATVLASCANDAITDGTENIADNTPKAIGFNMGTSATTKATPDAEKLGNMFIVWGEKNETGGAKATEGNLVFENYKVVSGTGYAANSSTTNTNGWEYVGVTPFTSDANGDAVSPIIGGDSKQTIKYWDNNATSYTFTAITAKEDDLKKGEDSADPKVKITKIQGSDDSGATTYGKGYTVEVAAGASTGNIYFADRVVVSKETGATAYKGEPVKFTFRNFQSKIRFGIYETVQGYKVNVTGVKYGDNTTTASTSKFGVDGDFVLTGSAAKYTVTYVDNTNKAQVTVNTDGSSTTKTKYFEGGENIVGSNGSNEKIYLGTSSATATFDNTDGAYTAIMPNPQNATDMTLTISYDLISEDSNEKISVTDQVVKVPAEYCKWKSNYAYTYLFKISDASTGMKPITFDACLAAEETEGTWEDITAVADTSITTFATTSANDGTIVNGKDEYEANNVIYASVKIKGNDSYSNATLSTGDNGNVKLYTVTTTDAANFPITEASVKKALTTTDADSSKVKATAVTTTGDNAPTVVTSVPTENGGTISMSALKWTASAGTTYAIEYTSGTSKTYKIVKVAATQNKGN